MAKKICSYKGFILKETTPKDNTTYAYQAVKDGEVEWEEDNLDILKQWVDSY